jgi:hypothetical protein
MSVQNHYYVGDGGVGGGDGFGGGRGKSLYSEST